MPNTFSMPNYHEDQPSPIEAQLIGQLAGANPGGNKSLAGVLLQAEQGRRAATQQDYHDYLAGVNQLQAGSIRANSMDHEKTEFNTALQHAIPGSLQAYGAQFPGSIPQDPRIMDPLNESIRQRQMSVDASGLGKGAEGGMLYAPDAMPAGMQQGEPAVVTAAQKNADSRVEAARVGASAKPTGYSQRVWTPDKTKPLDQQTDRTYQYGDSGGSSGAPAGLRSAIKPAPSRGGTSPLGKSDAASRAMMSDPSLVETGGAGASTAAPPSAGYSDGQVAAAVVALGNRNRAQHADVMKQAAINGGKPMVGVRSDGKPGLVGTNGQVY